MKLFSILATDDRQKQIFIIILILLAAVLSLSPFLVGFSQVLLFFWWIFSGRWTQKYKRLQESFWVLLPISFLFLIPLISLIYSDNTSWGIKLLTIKFPLFALAVAFATTPRLNAQQLQIIENIFIAGLLASCSVGIIVGYQQDGRASSVFISHIRQALYVSLAIFLILNRVLSQTGAHDVSHLLSKIIVIAFFVAYLILLTAMTGILVSIALTIFMFFYYRKIILGVLWLRIAFVLFAALGLYALFTTYTIVRQFINNPDMEELSPEKYTSNGNAYKHHWSQTTLENGNYAGIYICEDELRPLWNAAANTNFDSLDQTGQKIKYTLFRYMASKGLRKDSLGFSQLNVTDIKNIESGMSNYLFANKNPIYVRLYQLVWEIHQYVNGANPSGNSLTQRFEFWRTAIYLIGQKFWLGHGIGDLQEVYAQAYMEMDSQLRQPYRLRAHNQFLTAWVSTGFFGFVLFIIALLVPFVVGIQTGNSRILIVFLIVFLSMLTEDTFETQAGVSLWAFFMNLYLFNPKTNHDDN